MLVLTNKIMSGIVSYFRKYVLKGMIDTDSHVIYRIIRKIFYLTLDIMTFHGLKIHNCLLIKLQNIIGDDVRSCILRCLTDIPRYRNEGGLIGIFHLDLLQFPVDILPEGLPLHSKIDWLTHIPSEHVSQSIRQHVKDLIHVATLLGPLLPHLELLQPMGLRNVFHQEAHPQITIVSLSPSGWIPWSHHMSNVVHCPVHILPKWNLIPPIMHYPRHCLIHWETTTHV